MSTSLTILLDKIKLAREAHTEDLYREIELKEGHSISKILNELTNPDIGYVCITLDAAKYTSTHVRILNKKLRQAGFLTRQETPFIIYVWVPSANE